MWKSAAKSTCKWNYYGVARHSETLVFKDAPFLTNDTGLVGHAKTLCQFARFVRLSRLHDQADFGCVSDFLKGIRLEDYNVGEEAWRDLTEFAFFSQSLR